MLQKRIKILLLGDIKGVYRSQNLIKALNDNNNSYIVSGVCRGFYQKQSIRKRNPTYHLLKRPIEEIFYCFETFIKVPFADVLYLLPMNHQYFPLAFLLKNLFRKPLIAEFYFSLYDGMVNDRKQTSERSFKAAYYKCLDKWLLTASDKIIHLTRRELDYVAQKLDISLDYRKISILPIAIEPKKISNSAPSLNQAFRLCWWGTYIPLHGLDRIMEAVYLLKKRNFSFSLTIFGVPGSKGEYYKQMVNNLNLGDHVKIREDVSFVNGLLEEYLIHNCDLSLGIFGSSGKAKHSIPNKIIDAFAMKLPVLTMSSPILDEFIDPNSELFTCDANPEQIAQAIMNIAADKKQCRARAEAGYQRYLKTFTVKNYQKKALEIIDDLAGCIKTTDNPDD